MVEQGTGHFKKMLFKNISDGFCRVGLFLLFFRKNISMTKSRSMAMTDNHRPESYSDSGFWEKLKKYAKSAGSEVVEKALTLYYVAADSNTPASAKAIIYGALGYFIFPVDIISDFIPVVGYTDDTVALAAAVKAMVDYTEQDHIDAAKEKIKEWFG
jgi:uncharacterized membrane protein YkvA (DUF1232 family)